MEFMILQLGKEKELEWWLGGNNSGTIIMF